MQGRIVQNISNQYEVEAGNSIYDSQARGKFKNEDITPVVGDNVIIEITDENNKKAVITNILERKVYIKRPKIANITQIIFVVSLKNPKPDLLLLDKQLAFAEFLGVKSVIIFNKIDLDSKYSEITELYKKIGYKVIETVAKEKVGIDEVKKVLKGETSAFSGNSGVGKSTLINAIFNNNTAEEGEISKRNKRGKNTTTAIKLYKLDDNAYIADTPGFSTFEISEINSENLDQYFIEFRNPISNCKFIGCSHIKEEGCGVKEAVKKGEINISRYENFCKIYDDLKEKEKRKW